MIRQATELILIGAFIVLFWATVFAVNIDSPILSTYLDWLAFYGFFVVLLVLSRAVDYFTTRHEKMIHKEEK